MAEFTAGDRVVKMSGIAAGKYGTVNSVREDGTLNVTFDGERMARFCDPERCGKVAANAKFKVGDRVKSAKYPELGEMKVVRVFQDIHGTAYRTSRDGFLTDDIHYDRTLIPANSCARNDRVKGHFVWFAPWNGRAGEAADEIVAKVPGAKREGANIVRVKDEDSAATVYALFRKAKVPTRDLNVGFNSVRSTNAVVAKALNACGTARNANVCNADAVPPDLWEKLKRTSLAYVVAGELKNGKSVDELIARFRKSGPGSQIPGRAQDSAIAASVLEEMKRRGINACGTARNAESPEDYDGNMHQVISSIAYDLEKTALQLGKAVSLWEKADKSEYAKGEAEKSLALDRRLYSLVISALQYMRKAEQASA